MGDGPGEAVEKPQQRKAEECWWPSNNGPVAAICLKVLQNPLPWEYPTSTEHTKAEALSLSGSPSDLSGRADVSTATASVKQPSKGP